MREESERNRSSEPKMMFAARHNVADDPDNRLTGF